MSNKNHNYITFFLKGSIVSITKCDRLVRINNKFIFSFLQALKGCGWPHLFKNFFTKIFSGLLIKLSLYCKLNTFWRENLLIKRYLKYYIMPFFSKLPSSTNHLDSHSASEVINIPTILKFRNILFNKS